jgi:hypothetical protein
MEAQPSNSELTAPTDVGFAGAAHDALVAYFTDQHLAIGVGQSGEILIPFDAAGRRLVVVATIGDRREVGVRMQLITVDPIAREHWAATLVAVNRWNMLVPCPRAVLSVSNWEADPDGTLMLDAWLPYGTDGVDRAQLEQVAAAVLAASSYFATAGLPRQDDAAAGPPGPECH